MLVARLRDNHNNNITSLKQAGCRRLSVRLQDAAAQEMHQGDDAHKVEQEKEEEVEARDTEPAVLAQATETRQRGTTHDRAVLIALFVRCGGLGWNDSTNWGSQHEPLSEWYNVTVSLGIQRHRFISSRVPALGGRFWYSFLFREASPRPLRPMFGTTFPSASSLK